MENTPKEIVVTVPESLAGISIRKDIHYSDDTVISIRVEEHDPGRYSGSGPDFTFNLLKCMLHSIALVGVMREESAVTFHGETLLDTCGDSAVLL